MTSVLFLPLTFTGLKL